MGTNEKLGYSETNSVACELRSASTQFEWSLLFIKTLYCVCVCVCVCVCGVCKRFGQAVSGKEVCLNT